MRIWRPVVGLSLLAAALAAEPLRPGEMRLHLSPARRAPLAPRAEDFASRLCPGAGAPDVPGKASAYCRDKHSNKPPEKSETSQPFLQLGLLSLQAGDDGILHTSLYARGLSFHGSQPLETPCGRWTWSLRLDPRATQPVSTALLEPGLREASRGTFSGAVEMLAQLRFEQSAPDRRVVVPVTLRLDLNGPWDARAAADGALPDELAATNLSLFASRPGCFRLPPLAGRICLSPAPSGLAPNHSMIAGGMEQ